MLSKETSVKQEIMSHDLGIVRLYAVIVELILLRLRQTRWPIWKGLNIDVISKHERGSDGWHGWADLSIHPVDWPADHYIKVNFQQGMSGWFPEEGEIHLPELGIQTRFLHGVDSSGKWFLRAGQPHSHHILVPDDFAPAPSKP